MICTPSSEPFAITDFMQILQGLLEQGGSFRIIGVEMVEVVQNLSESRWTDLFNVRSRDAEFLGEPQVYQATQEDRTIKPWILLTRSQMDIPQNRAFLIIPPTMGSKGTSMPFPVPTVRISPKAPRCT